MIASVGLVLVAAAPVAPGAPSFDCAKAGSRVERLICADAELRGADLALAAAYAGAAKRAHSRGADAALRDDQRAWLAARDACADPACLLASYRRRAAELTRLGIAWGDADSVVVACDARANTVRVEEGRIAVGVGPEVDVAKAPLDAPRFALTSLDRRADCRLDDGRSVRLKIDTVPGPGFGECGAGESLDLSVWVDEAPVVSRLEIVDRCHDRDILHTLTLDTTSIKTCMTSARTDDPSGLAPPECTTRPLPPRREPDRVEYPASPGPVEGTILTAYASDPDFCRSMIVKKTDVLGQPAWEISPPPGSRTGLVRDGKATSYRSGGREHLGGFSVGSFDADNDGKLDRVYWLDSQRSDLWSDVYFVLGREPAVDDDELDEDTLRNRSRLVFPDSWVRAAAGTGVLDEYTLTVKHGVDPTHPLSVRLDRLELKPFSLRGTTYFHADSSRDGGPDRTELVLRPLPTGAADEVCVFRHVVRHM